MVAAKRGHRVSLYEQEDRLGGQFHSAAIPPHKEDFLDIIRHLELMARRSGVEIRLNAKVTTEMVTASRPDVVILATGGIPLTVPFPGLDETDWLLASDLLEGAAAVRSPSALVIGGGLVGLETADFLSAKGKKVTLVEMLPDTGADMDQLAKAMITKRLEKNLVTIHTNSRVVRLIRNAAIVQRGEDLIRLPVETVVVAVGVRANRELPDALANSRLEVHVVGDAVEPRKALDAIYEGFEIACGL